MGIKIIEPYTEDPDYGVEYTVIHEDCSIGCATLRITELNPDHHLVLNNVLQGENVPMDSRVAELHFYPHSETSPRRKGLGSKALDFILTDAKKRGIRVVYAEVRDTKVVMPFFRKAGFKGNYAPNCYFVLS